MPEPSPPVSLSSPLRVGNIELRNRLYRAPVLEGAGAAPDPAAVYAKHFVPNAAAGLGLVIQGNTIVAPRPGVLEGRTSPGMSCVGAREDMLALAPVTRGVHGAGGRIVIQLGHGGAFALESWHAEYKGARSGKPWAPSRLPAWIRPFHTGVHVPSTEEVRALIARFGVVAAWAREAGYDGVQLAASNAKLLHQFVSPVYNRRDDAYGGDDAGRFRLLAEIRQAIAREAGEDYPVLLKLAVVEAGPSRRRMRPGGIATLSRRAEDAGFAALTPVNADLLPNTAICRGAYPAGSFTNPKVSKRLYEAAGSKRYVRTIQAGMWLAARRYPFESMWNREVFSAVKGVVSIPVFAVGGIRSPREANELLARGEADLIGVGRPFYAEPDLARRFLDAAAADDAGFDTACQSCNQCIVPQMLGLPGICYNPEVNTRRRRQQQ